MKKINYELIPEEHEAYRVLSKMRVHHRDVSDADIGLAWQKQLSARSSAWRFRSEKKVDSVSGARLLPRGESVVVR